MQTAHKTSHNPENINFKQILQRGKELPFHQRVQAFDAVLKKMNHDRENLYLRRITTPADHQVTVTDPFSGARKKMLMFGSNNYLGLANHPYVREKAIRAIREYGAGIGGPPLLNGYTNLHRELEERLAAFKDCEDALIFSSGYSANIGLINGLVNPGDTLLYDAYSHASFYDGVRMAGIREKRIDHNDVQQLAQLLREQERGSGQEIFVGVEGVYSMDGDLAPLDKIVPLCKKHRAILMVDDAHGTGVMGETGSGTAEHFDVKKEVDINMGTFSKTFSVTGAFVAASKPLISYLRYFARSYMFSASLPPVVIATVLAGLEVIKREPERLTTVRENVRYAAQGLRSIGFPVNPQAAIITLRVPPEMDMRRMAYRLHESGIFLNSVEYPAVPLSEQRFRISLMATHTKAEIDRLVTAIENTWTEEKMRRHSCAVC